VPTELNVLALVKGTERYIFVYDDQSQAELVNVFRDQAADPRLSLSWFDATVLTRKAREQADMHADGHPEGETPAPERIRESP
jgi:hypothetical protein